MRRACLGLLCLLACEQAPWQPDYSNHPYVPPPPGTYPEGMSPPRFPEQIDPALDAELGRPATHELVARAAFETLESYCASCHGKGNDRGGFASVLDIPALIEQGRIVPGASADSPLLNRLLDGSMPPAPLPAPNSGDLALIARFIDELAPADTSCAATGLPGIDELLPSMVADLVGAPEGDRRFRRYVRLTAAPGPGGCAALEQQRWALFKLVNSVSTRPAIVRPVALDEAGLLYRLDLRDYGWDRALDVDGDGTTETADGWLALSASVGPYAVELAGREVDLVKQLTQTSVPLLPADALVHAATAGELYYELVGVLPELADTKRALGVEDALWGEGPLLRAGLFVFRRDTNKESLIRGAERPGLPGSRYWTIEDNSSEGSESIFEDPVDLKGYPSLSIFQLPNGLPAFAVEGSDGQRAAMIPECNGYYCTEPQRAPAPARVNAASCQACHAEGLLPARDIMSEWVRDNRVLFDNDTAARVQEQFVPYDVFDQSLRAQNALQLSALEQAGVPASAPEPISRVYFAFEQEPLGAAQVAAQIGVSEPSLLAALGTLDPALAPLAEANGQIERATLSAALPAARCALLAGARNRPVLCP